MELDPSTMPVVCEGTQYTKDYRTDPRPIGFQPRYRYLTADAVRAVLSDFYNIYTLRQKPEELREYLQDHKGTLLSLGAPSDRYLCIRPKDQISFSLPTSCADFPGVPKGEYTFLGEGIRIGERGCLAILGWAFYLGPNGELYCYVAASNALYLVALDVDELARRGLINYEFLYDPSTTGNFDLMPITARTPKTLVDRIMVECTKENGMTSLEDLQQFVRLNQHSELLLHTPGEGDHRLFITPSPHNMHDDWPLCRMTTTEYVTFRRVIDVWLQNRKWTFFGVVKSRLGRGAYRVQSVLVADVLGAFYHVDPSNFLMWRCAENLGHLMRMGLAKIYMPGRRFDCSDAVARSRGEAAIFVRQVRCDWESLYKKYEGDVTRNHAERIEWLMREDRFVDPPVPWDETEKSMLRRPDYGEAEKLRHEVESKQRSADTYDYVNRNAYYNRGDPDDEDSDKSDKSDY